MNVADGKVRTIEQALMTHDINDGLESASFCHRRCIEENIVQTAQALNAFDGVLGIKAAPGVRQNQAHIRIALTIAPDRRLIDRVSQGAVAHHMQGDGQPQLTG